MICLLPSHIANVHGGAHTQGPWTVFRILTTTLSLTITGSVHTSLFKHPMNIEITSDLLFLCCPLSRSFWLSLYLLQEKLCLPHHILEEKGLVKVSVTVQALVDETCVKQALFSWEERGRALPAAVALPEGLALPESVVVPEGFRHVTWGGGRFRELYLHEKWIDGSVAWQTIYKLCLNRPFLLICINGVLPYLLKCYFFMGICFLLFNWCDRERTFTDPTLNTRWCCPDKYSTLLPVSLRQTIFMCEHSGQRPILTIIQAFLFIFYLLKLQADGWRI